MLCEHSLTRALRLLLESLFLETCTHPHTGSGMTCAPGNGDLLVKCVGVDPHLSPST